MCQPSLIPGIPRPINLHLDWINKIPLPARLSSPLLTATRGRGRGRDDLSSKVLKPQFNQLSGPVTAAPHQPGLEISISPAVVWGVTPPRPIFTPLYPRDSFWYFLWIVHTNFYWVDHYGGWCVIMIHWLSVGWWVVGDNNGGWAVYHINTSTDCSLCLNIVWTSDTALTSDPIIGHDRSISIVRLPDHNTSL